MKFFNSKLYLTKPLTNLQYFLINVTALPLQSVAVYKYPFFVVSFISTIVHNYPI